MDFEIDKILAKVSGKNVENFSNCIISDTVKAQIDFAFNQMFSGLSVLQWIDGGTLSEAWTVALDKMRDFVFSLSDKNYVTDYLYHAVFDFKKNIVKTVFPSVHANEYCNCPVQQQKELKTDANQKVKQGMDIIMSLVSEPSKCCVEKQEFVQKMNVNQNVKDRGNEREREK